MSKLVLYIICAVLLLPFVLELRYFMQMFQQNSYKADRFLRWYKSALLPHFALRKKVKFVFTPRMQRLFFTAILLWFVLTIVLGAPAAIAAVILCPWIMLAANLVNTPVEKAFTQYYIRDARRILRQHPGLIIVGVTGSFGKTSTKNFLYRILSEKYNTLITPGNFNTTLGVVRTIREQLKPHHQVFIVEMGAKQVGDIAQICDLVHPSVAIVTAVGPMHLETFHSIENIRKTKFELVDALPDTGFAAINADSPDIAAYQGVRTDCRVERYSLSELTDLSYTPQGTDFTLGSERFHTPLLGSGNILNVLGALKVASYLGVPLSAQKIAVGKLTSVEHRLSMTRAGGITILDDAYNSNPAGAAMALEVLSGMKTCGRKILVTPGFVELGSAQEQECRNLGARAAAVAQVLVIVNRYNRDAIYQGALQAGMPEDNIVCVDNLNQAAAFVQAYAAPGDVVLYENDLPDTFK